MAVALILLLLVLFLSGHWVLGLIVIAMCFLSYPDGEE